MLRGEERGAQVLDPDPGAQGFDEIKRRLDPFQRLIEVAQIALDARNVRERDGFTTGLANIAREFERLLQVIKREPRVALLTMDPAHSDESAGFTLPFADCAPDGERPLKVFERLLFITQFG